MNKHEAVYISKKGKDMGRIIKIWFTYEDMDKKRCVSARVYLHIEIRTRSAVKEEEVISRFC